MKGNNPFQIIQMFQQARNPQQMLMGMLQNNPKYKTALDQAQNSANGASYENIAKQIAQQQGISEQQLMQMYNSLNRRK
jgi:hypothetical protein